MVTMKIAHLFILLKKYPENILTCISIVACLLIVWYFSFINYCSITFCFEAREKSLYLVKLLHKHRHIEKENNIFMGGSRFIVAGAFIDGSGAEVRRNVFLAVKDAIITAIGSAADLPRHDGAAIDDFSHCVILPALVDCSVSLTRSPSVDRKVRLAAEEADPAEKAAMLERHISYCHAYGVLGVADSDDLTGLVERYQEGLAPESIIDIRTSGGLCRSRQEWAAGNPAGGDFLKIGYSANIEDEEAPRLPSA